MAMIISNLPPDEPYYNGEGHSIAKDPRESDGLGEAPVLEAAMFGFGEAINRLRKGEKLRRRGWNGKNIFIALQVPDENSKMTHEYIYIDTTNLETDNEDAPRDRVPWLASQTDMLSFDWEVWTPKN